MSENAMSNEGLDIGWDSMIRDEPGYRIGFTVEALDSKNGIEMVLRTDDRITWWKSLSYFVSGQSSDSEIRIETQKGDHEARQFLFEPDLTSSGRFELWKGGFGGFGAFAGRLPINAWANRGRRLIFTWHQD